MESLLTQYKIRVHFAQPDLALLVAILEPPSQVILLSSSNAFFHPTAYSSARQGSPTPAPYLCADHRKLLSGVKLAALSMKAKLIGFHPQARLRRRSKVALLIGIDYRNTGSFELNGSRKDIEALEELLRDLNFDKVIVLSDREGTPDNMAPTNANILRELEALIPSHPNANFFFAYSGHCYQRPGYVAEEDGGKEQCIIPCDGVKFSQASDGMDDPDVTIVDSMAIPDKTLNRFLVQCLPEGSQLVALFDSCYSGTLLNLRHRQCNRVEGYRSIIQDGFRRVYEPLQHEMSKAKAALFGMPRREKHCYSTNVMSESSDHLLPTQEAASRKKRMDHCMGFCPRLPIYEKQVICFSSCDDSQATLDSHDGGAMIQSFVQLLKTNKGPTYRQIMKSINDGVRRDRRRRLDDYFATSKSCDVTCSVFQHRWCLASNERLNKTLIRAKCEPQLSSLRPLNTRGILKL